MALRNLCSCAFKLDNGEITGLHVVVFGVNDVAPVHLTSMASCRRCCAHGCRPVTFDAPEALADILMSMYGGVCWHHHGARGAQRRAAALFGSGFYVALSTATAFALSRRLLAAALFNGSAASLLPRTVACRRICRGRRAWL